MKTCNRCNIKKDESQFWVAQRMCKSCRRVYDKERYKRDPKKRQEANTKWIKKNLSRLRELKSTYPCTDCKNFYHPVAMQFDHLPGTEKVKAISLLVYEASWERILKEIEKCELVCANCHAVRTENRRCIDNG